MKTYRNYKIDFSNGDSIPLKIAQDSKEFVGTIHLLMPPISEPNLNDLCFTNYELKYQIIKDVDLSKLIEKVEQFINEIKRPEITFKIIETK